MNRWLAQGRVTDMDFYVGYGQEPHVLDTLGSCGRNVIYFLRVFGSFIKTMNLMRY